MPVPTPSQSSEARLPSQLPSQLPSLRRKSLNHQPVRIEKKYVLYWMIASRRSRFNFGLERAIELAESLAKPLLVFEAVTTSYPWASVRLHRFLCQGMRVNRTEFARTKASYYGYVEPSPQAGAGLVDALAKHACVVVTDDFPCFFLPEMTARVAQRLPVAVESIDSNGLLPMRAVDRVFPTAHSFRRHLQKHLLPHLSHMPKERPLSRTKIPSLDELPREIVSRWPPASDSLLAGDVNALRALPIDGSVGPAAIDGGASVARKRMQCFMQSGLAKYGERLPLLQESTSGLSPYLHFGHIGAHEVFHQIADHQHWTPSDCDTIKTGAKEGWWNMEATAEAFLDQLVTWRELGFNMCWQQRYDQFETLPDWAQATLNHHAHDPRPNLYSQERLECAQTHDPLWNAAQNQMVREGRMHNYLRMLWGKKILEWSTTPHEALETMLHLNNKYALDGRDPNSYSGIFWCLGRYDRAWGPERPIFGKIRYMSSDNTARKFPTKDYIQRFGSDEASSCGSRRV